MEYSLELLQSKTNDFINKLEKINLYWYNMKELIFYGLL